MRHSTVLYMQLELWKDTQSVLQGQETLPLDEKPKDKVTIVTPRDNDDDDDKSLPWYKRGQFA
jgi:hypothetical protein